MSPEKTMVVDCPSANPLPLRTDWYPGATWIHGLPTAEDFRVWLQDVDVVYTAETGYGHALWDEAERQGVRTILHANWEFLDHHDRPTVWAAPSLWHYGDIPFPNKCFLPVPIDTAPQTVHQETNVVHVVGRPAIHDRNGTLDLIEALQFVQSPLNVTITCQDPHYVTDLLARYRLPDHVAVHQLSGDISNRWDLYRNQSVLVMPRRFGGLSLPVNEALAMGMPVIMPDIAPNDWLPKEWLVPARVKTSFRAKQHIDVYETDRHELAATIDRVITDDKAPQMAQGIAKSLSWDTLKPLYEKTLRGDV
jgi:glycosyltransferase involved in cell wall biosynthesis